MSLKQRRTRWTPMKTPPGDKKEQEEQCTCTTPANEEAQGAEEAAGNHGKQVADNGCHKASSAPQCGAGQQTETRDTASQQ